MAKFYGKVGFQVPTETRKGVWSGTTEKYYQGDVLHLINRNSLANVVKEGVTLENQISIVANPFAINNFSTIIFVEYLGTKWSVKSAEIKYPRIILNLGGVYNERSIELTG